MKVSKLIFSFFFSDLNHNYLPYTESKGFMKTPTSAGLHDPALVWIYGTLAAAITSTNSEKIQS